MLARLLIIAAAVAGGAVLGRNAVNKKVEETLPAEIEAARTQAVIELDKQISQVVREKLSAFAINLIIKSGLIGAVFLLFDYGHLSATGLKVTTIFLIFLFLLRDITKTLPFFLPAWRHVRTHNWKFRKAFVEFIAGIAFERAYAQAMIAMETGPNRMWVAFSKYTAQSISEEVGAAVADVARSISVERVKWRARIGGLLALLMLLAYVGFFWSTVGAATIDAGK